MPVAFFEICNNQLTRNKEFINPKMKFKEKFDADGVDYAVAGSRNAMGCQAKKKSRVEEDMVLDDDYDGGDDADDNLDTDSLRAPNAAMMTTMTTTAMTTISTTVRSTTTSLRILTIIPPSQTSTTTSIRTSRMRTAVFTTIMTAGIKPAVTLSRTPTRGVSNMTAVRL